MNMRMLQFVFWKFIDNKVCISKFNNQYLPLLICHYLCEETCILILKLETLIKKHEFGEHISSNPWTPVWPTGLFKKWFFFSYQMLIFCHVPLRRLAKVQAWMCYRYCCFSYLWCFAVCLSIFFLNIASPISCSVFILFVYFFYLFCVISLIYILIFETPLGLKNQWKAKHV